MPRGYLDAEDEFHEDDGESLDGYDPADFQAPRHGTGASRLRRSGDPGFDLTDVEVIAETDAALKIRGEGLSSDPFGVADKNEEAWVPKSQIHSRSELTADSPIGSKGTMVISKWLAEKRGLV